jgi:exonuclease SbcC
MDSRRESERAVSDVASALRARMGGLQRLRPRRADVLDALYSFPCGVLGIHVCETWDELRRRWQEAQHELGSLMRSQGSVRGWGSDAYLLFVVGPGAVTAVDEAEREALLWEIRASASECLKDVLPLTAEWQEFLDDLSFVPLERFGTVPERASSAVSRILMQTGVPSSLALDVAHVRPGAQRLAQQMDNGSYGDPPGELRQLVRSGPKEGDASGGPPVPHVDSSPQRLRLNQLAITNFRSFRGNATATEVDLSADFVLIYGENGSGKTSLIQAMEWALCGDVRCLREAVERESTESYQSTPLRNMWTEGEPARVCFTLSDGRGFRRDEDGLHGPDSGLVSDEALWSELLGITRWRHQPITALRDRSSASFLLGQEQLRELLIDCPPDERLGRLAALLGDSGLGRATGKLNDVVAELQRLCDGVQSEKAALLERTEAAGAERASIVADLNGLGDDPAPPLTPERYLACTREYHLTAGVRADGPAVRPGEGGATRGAVHQIVEHLERRRAALVAAVARARRLGELSRELATARETLARVERTLGEARLRHKEASAASSGLDERASRLAHDCDELRSATSQCTSRRLLIERWLAVKPEVTALSNQLSQVSHSASSLLQQIAALEEELRRKSGAVESARELLVEARTRYEDNVHSIGKLAQLAQLVEQHGDVGSRLNALRSQKADVDASLAAARESAAAAHGRRDGAVRRLAVLEERLDQVRAQRQVRDRLLHELREHVDGNECPLCSHVHATRDELLAVIERRIGTPSPEELGLLVAIQTEEGSVDEETRVAAGLDLQVSGTDRKCRETADAIAQASSALARITELCGALGLPLDAALGQVSARLKQRQDDLVLNKRSLERRERDVANWGRALDDIQERRGAVSAELEQTLNEKREIDGRLGAKMAKLRVPQELQQADDATLAHELESCRERQSDLARQITHLTAELDHTTAARDAAREALELRQADVESIQLQMGDLAPMVARLESDLRVLEREQPKADAEDPQQALSKVERLVSDGRSVLRMLDAATARRRLTGVEEHIASLASDARSLDERAARLARWQQTSRDAAAVLQREEAHVVKDGLEPMRGFARRIHARLARHPVFSQVDWSIDDTGLRFWAEPRPGSGHGVRLVQAYMNEAQQNIVALSIFLASALCRGGRLRTVVLDDPVQAMDEVNIYGLLDLLRQTASQAQVVMTTGRNDLFHLARAKFACLNRGDAHRFRAYRLRWGGPESGTLVDEVT